MSKPSDPWPTGLLDRLERASAECLGYPSHLGFSPGDLAALLALPVNNLGDPFAPSRSGTHAHDLERQVVASVAAMAGADPVRCRGYVSSGSTESVLHALASGRDTLRHRVGKTPIIVASDQAHGCVAKSARLLDLPLVLIPSGPNGAIHLEALRSILGEWTDRPCLAVATAGTTFLGAIDPVDAMARLLQSTHSGRHHLHIDAALSGFLLPHTAATGWNLAAGGHSFSVSGHKMIGVPVPCGISVWREDAFDWPQDSPGYLLAPDITLSGSRAGMAVGALWLALHYWPKDRLAHESLKCLENAEWLVKVLRAAGWPVLRHPHATTVVFPKPAESLCARWQLHVEGTAAHVVVVPRVTRELLARFVASLGSGPGISSDFLPERANLR